MKAVRSFREAVLAGFLLLALSACIMIMFQHSRTAPTPWHTTNQPRLSTSSVVASRSAHQKGVALLKAGKVDVAIAALEDSLESSLSASIADAIAAERNPHVLNDLAAAYLTRNRAGETMDAYFAVEAAERAWRQRQTPEIAWNRALALEAVHLRTAALRAWIEFSEIEPDAVWRSKAAERVAALTLPTISRRWASWRGSPRVQAPRVSKVHGFAQELRLHGEDDLLGRWAVAVETSARDANDLLVEAEQIGSMLAESGGDALLRDAVAIIRKASKDAPRVRRLAAAHSVYSKGRQIYERQQMIDAMSHFETAAKMFTAERSPFALRAQLYLATTQYYAARHGSAEQTLQRLCHTAPSTYPVIMGQSYWVLGLSSASRGRTNEALAAYKAALVAFHRAGELESKANIEASLAQMYRIVGQSRLAMIHQRNALRSLLVVGKSRRAHAIFTDAARTASGQGAPLTALAFQERVLTIAGFSRDAVSIADALIGHAVYATAAGERSIAEANLREAKRVMATIRDDTMRSRSTANLLAAEATVVMSFDPHRAAQTAQSAVEAMERLGHRIRLVQLHFDAGRALARVNRRDEALRQWDRGIAECERQREQLTSHDYRRTYFDTCRSLFEEAIGTLARTGRHTAALQLADQGRARGLRDLVMQFNRSTNLPFARGPANVTVVEYSVLPDHLIIWVINGEHIFTSVQTIDRQDLRKKIARLATNRSDEIAFHASLAQIYQLAVQPVRSHMGQRVVFVPDDDLYRVPFAALTDHQANFLMERHEISIAPSLAFLTATEPTKPRSREVVLIAAGTGQSEQYPPLPAVRREMEKLRSIYRAAAVLEGAACTKAAVTASMERGGIIHFAGHAKQTPPPEDPALVLAAEGTDTGFLYPHEILRLSLHRTSLIVLGGCATADGPIGSEGALSIARAFVGAGAAEVVATLWEIDDEETSNLLVRFHREHARHGRAAEALRSMQLRAMHDGISASEWAAFALLQASGLERKRQ